MDAVLAAVAYVTAFWVRFPNEPLSTVFSTVWSTMPLVVGVQLGVLALVRAYGRWDRLDWLVRLVLGVLLGTALALILVRAQGTVAASGPLFLADAVLLSMAAVGWRGVWVLRRRARAVAAAPTDELVDRSEDLTTFSGVVSALYAYRELLRNLVLKDLKLKYRGSVFGFLWSLANPLLMTVVYTVAFTVILGVRSETFVFSLLLGQLAWTFFAASATMSTGAIIDNAGLLKSVLFPRAILPIGVVLFNLAQYVLTIAVFLPLMMIWQRTPVAAPMMLFPAFLALQVVFSIGVALALATATAFFRDVRHLLEVALSVLFWSTPIVYELHQVPERLQPLILLSPLSSFVVAYQQMFVHQQWPDPTVWLVAAAQALGALAAGALLFLTFEDRFAEQV